MRTMKLLRWALVSALLVLSQSPAMARYIQADPIGMDGGWNRFAYAENTPTGYIDPLGLASQICTYPGGQGQWPHMFTCVNGNCAGWYPSMASGTTPKGPWEAMINSNGAYVPDNDKVSKSYCAAVSSCDEAYTDQCILACRNNANRPSHYNVVSSSCINAVQQCVEGCVINSCKMRIMNFFKK